MDIGLHVGVRFAGHDTLRRSLTDNAAALAQRGWAVAPRDRPTPEIDPDELAARWTAWLGSPAVGDATHALFSNPRLTEQLLVRGEAASLVGAMRAHGAVRAVAAVRRMDDHIASSYLGQLRAGRAAPLRGMDLIGGGNKYNYFAKVDKWRSAVGDGFSAVLCSPDRSAEDFVACVLGALGLDGFDVAGSSVDETLAAQLSVDGAEALRWLNDAMRRNETPPAVAEKSRALAFASLLESSKGERPFALPADAASELLRRFRDPAVDLAAAMAPDDANQYLSTEVAAGGEPRRGKVSALFSALKSELGMPELSPRQRRTTPSTSKQLRRRSVQAHEALVADDTSGYQRSAKRVHALLAEDPEFAMGRPVSDASVRIPNRIVQYWEPWPPPDEMLPWMDSWGSIGMRGGDHLVVSYDEGIAVMEEAAGARGAEAFAKAPHPAARADLYRYAELVVRGGWYVDAEHEALLPIPDILSWPVEHFFVRRPGGGLVPNGFIGAVPGSPLLRTVLDEACTNVVEGRGSTILKMTGPAMFSPLVMAYLATPEASYVMLPTTAVFAGVLHLVHNEADYKVDGHWRDQDLSAGS